MTEKHTPEKVAEARAKLAQHAMRRDLGAMPKHIHTVLDALTAVSAERDAAIRDLDAGFAESDHLSAKYYQRMRDAEREMHARELHHFEEEQISANLRAERDAVLAGKYVPLADLEASWRVGAGYMADRDRLHKAITEELSRHSEKHGESPRYAPDDYEAEREPMHWEPYVICNADGTDYPCRTRRILRAALDKEGSDDEPDNSEA